ncbi:unnamed protein product, partial [Effrenium voratum]
DREVSPRARSEEQESDFSSVASLSRQCTEFSDVVAQDLMSRQLTDFATRQGDFWLRKCTEPVPFRGGRHLEQGDFLRQSSCPPIGLKKENGEFATIQEAIVQEEPEDVAAEEEDDLISRAICAAVGDCPFSVAAADPTGLDSELIAVSEGFVELSGFDREEAVGANCRFLGEGCPASPVELREACDSGAPFTSILVNKRKNGEFFLNLLTLRGLVLARNPQSGEELWILMSVQQDVTGIAADALPSNDALMQKVAQRVGRRLLKYATEIGIARLVLSGKCGGVIDRHEAGAELQPAQALEGLCRCAPPTESGPSMDLIARRHGVAPPLAAMISEQKSRWYTSRISESSWREAIALLAELEEEQLEANTITYNAAMRSCGWPRALRVLRAMQAKDVAASVVTHNSAAGPRWAFAQSLLARLPEKRLEPSLVSSHTLLRGFATSRRWEPALAELAALSARGCRREVQTFNSVASCCGAVWTAAFRALRALRAAGLEPDGFASAGISAAGLSAWRQGVGLLRRLALGGLEPNVYCLGAAVAAVAAGASWRRAWEMLKEPNLVMYNAAVAAARWPQALWLLADASARFSLRADVVTFNSAAAAGAKAESWRSALRILEDLARQRLQKNAATCGIEVACLGVASAWRRGLVLAAKADAAACGALGAALARRELWAAAVGLLALARAQRIQANSLVFLGAIASCENSGRWARALRLLSAAPRDHEAGRGPVNAAISSCEKAAQWPWALCALGAHGWEVVGCNSALAACEKAAWRLALRLLAKMQAVALLPQLPAPDVMSYFQLTRCTEGGGGFRQAAGWLEAAEQRAAEGLRGADGTGRASPI